MKNGFYVHEVIQRLHLTEGAERGPIRRTKHKDHIEKVMSISNVACLRGKTEIECA